MNQQNNNQNQNPSQQQREQQQREQQQHSSSARTIRARRPSQARARPGTPSKNADKGNEQPLAPVKSRECPPLSAGIPFRTRSPP